MDPVQINTATQTLLHEGDSLIHLTYKKNKLYLVFLKTAFYCENIRENDFASVERKTYF